MDTDTNDSNNEFQLSLSTYYDEADTINDMFTNPNGYTHGGGFTIESTSLKNFTFNFEKSYEVEYCIKATSNAVVGNTYLFAVMGGDMDYHPLPKLTITSHINTTVFIEGPFNGIDMNTDLNSMGVLPLSQPYNEAPWNYFGGESVGVIPNEDIVDWVLIELRDAVNASSAISGTMFDRKAVFLLLDGSIVDLDGSSIPTFSGTINNQLFVVIHHRNHLSIMSSTEVTPFGGMYSYDFSDGGEEVYGGANGHKQIAAGIWGMFNANGDGDQIILAYDRDIVWDPQAGTTGYKDGDFNMNGQVDNEDKDDHWYENTGEISQVPN